MRDVVRRKKVGGKYVGARSDLVTVCRCKVSKQQIEANL